MERRPKRDRAATTRARLQAELVSMTKEMTPAQLRYCVNAARVVALVGNAFAATPENADAITRQNSAVEVARRWPDVVIDAIYAHEGWSRAELLKIAHCMLARLDAQLDEGAERRALDVMKVAASFLHTGTIARGAIVRRGDSATARRIARAHDALIGATSYAIGIREVSGILRESMNADFVLRRLLLVDAKFKTISRDRLERLLLTYTPDGRPRRGSGKRSFVAIVATLIVWAGVFGEHPPKPGETQTAVNARIQDVCHRVRSALKRD